VKKLLEVENLHIVETVDREKIASTLNETLSQLKRDPLKVFVQINTSNEDNKGGISPKNFISLVEFILEKCPLLTFSGLMTIGSVEHSHNVETELNPDFKVNWIFFEFLEII
jgi:PLP dependent protein